MSDKSVLVKLNQH